MKKIVHKNLGLFVISLFVNANVGAEGIQGMQAHKSAQLLHENPELFKRFMSQLDMVQKDLDTQDQKKNTSGIIDTITNPTSISLEIEESLKRRLRYISDSLHMSKYHSNISKSIDDLDTFDTCLRSVERFASRADVTKENESVIFALLLKYVVRGGFLSFKERLNDLQEMQKLHRYWIEQKLHKTYYLLHKSPHKWFFGKSQDVEIDENIKYLENLQEAYYGHLGALASHLSKFDPQVEQNKQSEWALELLNRIDGIWGMHPSKKQDIADVAEFVSTVQKRLARVKEGRKTLQDLTSDVKKPNHFARNWLWYTGLAVVGIAAYKYYQNDPKSVENYFKMKVESLQDAFNSYVKGPTKDILRKLFDRESLSKDDVSTLKENANRRIEQDELNIDKLNSILGMHTSTDFSEIPDHLAPNYREYMDSILEQISVEIEEKQKALENQAAISYDSIVGKKINKGIDLGGVYGKLFTTVGLEVVKGEKTTADEALDAVYKVLERLELSINMGTLTPALLAGWAGAKGLRELYNKVTNRNFYQLSKYLKDIAILLEEDGRAFSHRKYGKLLFLTHQLKHEIVRLVPKKNNMQQEMLNDTIRIESRQSSIDEKIATLSSMKDHYFPFLYKGAVA